MIATTPVRFAHCAFAMREVVLDLQPDLLQPLPLALWTSDASWLRRPIGGSRPVSVATQRASENPGAEQDVKAGRNPASLRPSAGQRSHAAPESRLDSRPGFPGLLSAGMTSAGVTFFRGNDEPRHTGYKFPGHFGTNGFPDTL